MRLKTGEPTHWWPYLASGFVLLFEPAVIALSNHGWWAVISQAGLAVITANAFRWILSKSIRVSLAESAAKHYREWCEELNSHLARVRTEVRKLDEGERWKRGSP